MKITKYDVLSAVFIDDMIALVNQAIVDGWEPCGSLFSTGNGLLQPMARYEETIEIKTIDHNYREKLLNCPHREWQPHPTDVNKDQCKNCGIFFKDLSEFCNPDTRSHYKSVIPHASGPNHGMCRRCGVIFGNPQPPPVCDHEWSIGIPSFDVAGYCVKCHAVQLPVPDHEHVWHYGPVYTTCTVCGAIDKTRNNE